MSFMKRNSTVLYPPRIACYVCGAEIPSDYPLYPEPPPGCDLLLPSATPHFPFLLHHPPPLGCRPPSPGGVAKSCRVCYSTLMRQWDDYEKSSVPLERRIYWFERMDGLPVVTPELQVRSGKIWIYQFLDCFPISCASNRFNMVTLWFLYNHRWLRKSFLEFGTTSRLLIGTSNAVQKSLYHSKFGWERLRCSLLFII